MVDSNFDSVGADSEAPTEVKLESIEIFLGPTKVSPPKTENRSFVGHIPTESCT